MSEDNMDFDKLVKDHFRMRLTECGWVEVFSHIVKNAVQKRIENGQASKNIKFEQLYKDTIVEARDAVTNDMENEFHVKIEDYLSHNFNEVNKAITSPSTSVISAAGFSGTNNPSTSDNSVAGFSGTVTPSVYDTSVAGFSGAYIPSTSCFSSTSMSNINSAGPSGYSSSSPSSFSPASTSGVPSCVSSNSPSIGLSGVPSNDSDVIVDNDICMESDN